MPIVKNIHTGQEEYVRDDEAVELIRGGDYDLGEGESVNMADRFGHLGSTSDSDAIRDSLMTQGAQSASTEQVAEWHKEDRLRKKHDTLGQEILTGVEGGLRGASFGLSDVALRALGADAENMRNRARINDTIATGSELTGAIAPGLLSGGAGLGARILSKAPSALVTRGAANLAAKGAGRGLLARTGIRAAAGAAEGAAFGTGEAISRLALSDEPLSAERIVGELGSGALTGAAIGGAFGGGLSLAGDAVGAASKKVAQAAEVLPDKIKKLLPGNKKIATEELSTLRPRLAENLNKTRTTIGSVDYQMETAIAEARAAGMLPDGVVSDISLAVDDFERASSRLQSKGRKLPFQMGQNVDSEVFGKRVLDSFDELQELSPKNYTREIKKFGEYGGALDDYMRKAEELVDMLPQKDVQGVALTNAVPDLPGARDVVKKAMADLEALGALKDKATAKTDWQDYMAAADLLGIGDIEDLPLIGQIPFIDLYFKGRLLKRQLGKFGGKLGLKAATGEGTVATGRLAQSAANMADKTTDAIGMFLRGAGKTAKKAGALGKKTSIPGTIEILNSSYFSSENDGKYKAKTKHKAFKRRSDELLSMASNPQKIEQSVRASLGPVPENIAQKVIAVQTRKLQFLAEKLPKDPTLGRIIPKEFKPSDIEIRKFARYMRAAENPQSVIEDMAKGNLSQEAAETLRVVYPEMYASVQVQIMERLPELKEGLSYKKRLQLSRLFQVPVDDSMTPEFIQTMQADFNGDTEDMQNVMGMGGTVKMTATAAQNLSMPAEQPLAIDKLITSGPGQ